jgi:hypothetical protein
VDRPADGGLVSGRRPVLAGRVTAEAGDTTTVTVNLLSAPEQLVARLRPSIDRGRWSASPTRDLQDGVYALLAEQRDHAGHVRAHVSSSFLVDSTAPVTVDDNATIGTSWRRVPQSVNLSTTDLRGAGVAATYFTTDGSTPTIYSTRGTKVTIADDGTHVVRFFSVDRAGNTESVKTMPGQIRIDRTPPQLAALGPLPTIIHSGQVLSATGDDSLSGVARVVYELCADATSSTWTPIGSSATAPLFPMTWHRLPVDGSYRLRVRVIDVAGNAAVSDSATVRVDNTPPTGSTDGPEDGNPTTSTLNLFQKGR